MMDSFDQAFQLSVTMTMDRYMYGILISFLNRSAPKLAIVMLSRYLKSMSRVLYLTAQRPDLPLGLPFWLD